jgi:hypothetical protein
MRLLRVRVIQENINLKPAQNKVACINVAVFMHDNSDAQPVFRGTTVCHEIFTSHYNYNHNEINNCKNMNKYL